LSKSNNPTFRNLGKVKQAEDELFSKFQCPDEAVKEAIALTPLCRNIKVLFSGPPGTGKSALVAGISIVYFGGKNIGHVACDQSLMPDDVLWKLDLGALLKDGKEIVEARGIVIQPVKWIQEPGNANETLQKSLLSLLAEQEVVYRDQVFRSPDYLCFGDFNPVTLGGSSEFSWPFKDRWDEQIDIENLPLLSRVRLTLIKFTKGNIKDLRKIFQPVLSQTLIEEIWVDVERVDVPRWVAIFTELLIETYSGCVFDRNRQSQKYKNSCLQGKCEFYGELCSKIEVPISYRATDALISLAKARAWRARRTKINFDDVMFVFCFVLNHRIKLKSDFGAIYTSNMEFLTETLKTLQENKFNTFGLAAKHYIEIMEGKSSPETLMKLDDLSRKNLAVRPLFIEAAKFITSKESGIVETIEKTLSDLEKKTFTENDLDAIRKKIDEKVLSEGQRRRLTYRVDNLSKVRHPNE